MLETSARVIETEDGRRWLETRPRSACAGCRSDGCSAALLAEFFSTGRNRFPLEAGCDLQAGEEVVIGISDELLLRASVWAYLVPLAVMIPAVAAAARLGAGEGWQCLCAVGGLAVGLLLVRGIVGRRLPQQRLKPRLLRVAGAAATELCQPQPLPADELAQ
ncbi:MAG: SoxR reducing system RseC family protein [Gammaproteobacteria bacterium]|nr:SoxR reducing system RseC family protein [Gammaproteobacteria bacterium]MCB1860114.1 SoxR reducing system RseC family protein [Gammaproteobacteria bacterium]MCB1872482.1 SoxR reducing system RseC family protein [Gammaproteobacteria bacterium]MCB1902565.1 SoxR reducing system RseC family protein [Gammaproteobacteria bacterium]